MKTHQKNTVALDRDVFIDLENYARENEKTKTRIVSNAVRVYLARARDDRKITCVYG